MPYLNAIKLLKTFLRILWDISSACSISKHRKVTGLEWEEKNKTKTNQLGFLVVRSNVILYLSSYLYCSVERCNYKQSISSKQTKLMYCRKCFPSLKPRCGTEGWGGFNTAGSHCSLHHVYSHSVKIGQHNQQSSLTMVSFQIEKALVQIHTADYSKE